MSGSSSTTKILFFLFLLSLFPIVVSMSEYFR
jgi:hypothetical protein